jgi:hypothetical protein
MRMSDRLSDRATENSASSLINLGETVISGADEVAARSSRNPSVPRLGRRGLDMLERELTERDLAIVRSVADFRFLTARQIERLHFTTPGDTTRIMIRTSRRVWNDWPGRVSSAGSTVESAAYGRVRRPSSTRSVPSAIGSCTRTAPANEDVSRASPCWRTP